MRYRASIVPFGLAIALGAALAGCSRSTPAPVTSVDGSAEQAGRGIYKVGKPYQIEGIWYYPAEDLSYDESGIASWYGEQFHAKATANGEVFDMNTLTAAHRTLPLPSIVEVTNLDNGRSLQVRVNDRGPFARGRIIDMSRRSAQLLGFEAQGTAKVRVRILVPESMQVAALARRNGADVDAAATERAKAAPREAVIAEALEAAGRGTAKPAAVVDVPIPATKPPTPSAVEQVASAAEPPPLPGTVFVDPVKPTQIFIQAGSFSKVDNAYRAKDKLQSLGPVVMTGARVSGVDYYRVRLGPIGSVAEADRLLGQIVSTGMPEARIVVD